MKIESIIVIAFCLLLPHGAARAQTYYYNETKTFYENGYTYQCDNREGNVTLYNKQNWLTYVDKTYKDGSKLPEDIYRGRVQGFVEDYWTRPKADSIGRHTFSPQEKALIKDRSYVIALRINPETGRIDEVIFYFPAQSPYGQIPPSTFYKIEQALKREIWFTITEVGKQLNYVLISWEQEIM
jgi:hypothetical protein